MKMMRIIYIILISADVLVGCIAASPSNESEELFKKMYKECTMNEVLRLSLLEPMYSGDEDLNLLLESISDTSVIFPTGYNLQLLSFDNDQSKWIEEKNNIQYLPLNEKYIVGKNDPKIEFDHKLIGIDPRVRIKLALRVVIHGYIYKNEIETEECTGAFTDILFTP